MGNTVIDLTGNQYENWLVIRKSSRKHNSGGAEWVCSCLICKSEILVLSQKIRGKKRNMPLCKTCYGIKSGYMVQSLRVCDKIEKIPYNRVWHYIVRCDNCNSVFEMPASRIVRMVSCPKCRHRTDSDNNDSYLMDWKPPELSSNKIYRITDPQEFVEHLSAIYITQEIKKFAERFAIENKEVWEPIQRILCRPILPSS